MISASPARHKFSRAEFGLAARDEGGAIDRSPKEVAARSSSQTVHGAGGPTPCRLDVVAV
jgi:hypothetical protein